MIVPSKPSEIARETLRLLIARGDAPTPENYRRSYGEIAGTAADEPAPASVDWAGLLRELVRLTREHHFGLSAADKQAALDKALGGGDIHAVYDRVHALTTTWVRLPIAIAPSNAATDAASRPPTSASDDNVPPAARELRELLAHTLEVSIATRLIDAPGPAADAAVLAHRLRSLAPVDSAELRAQLSALWAQIELGGKRCDEIQAGLLRLLRLLAENVSELVGDDQWLRGQIAIVLQVISNPLELDVIANAVSNLQDVIRRQGLLKQSLNATKSTLKEMVASFIDELGKLSTATGDYHDSIENLAQQIRQTEDVDQLNVLLEEVLSETRSVQESALRSRQEVLRAREKVDAAEIKIRELESELEAVSEKVREDHLTGTLNRRGLNEAFDRELAVAERQAQTLCVALLDIDNFKAFNDQLGHQAGDDALVHLAQVIKETMRPSDTVARYGGEEFLILLPDTDIELAISIIGRLQRELTKRFFLHDHKKLLITFSAGVAHLAAGEKQADVIARADRALYQAKRTGKNRVLAAADETILMPPLPAAAPDRQRSAAARG